MFRVWYALSGMTVGKTGITSGMVLCPESGMLSQSDITSLVVLSVRYARCGMSPGKTSIKSGVLFRVWNIKSGCVQVWYESRQEWYQVRYGVAL